MTIKVLTVKKKNNLIDHSPSGTFQGQWKQMMKQIMQINITFVKNPNWQEADQLAIYKHGRGAELETTKKQLQLCGHSGTWTRDHRISSLAP